MTKVLDLVLCHRWYDMITQGPKREEYRRICPYWSGRLFTYGAGDIVRFRRGYSATFTDFRIVSVTTGVGRPEWGAPSYKVFIIKFEEL